MSNVSKWIMVFLVGAIIIGLVRNAAGTSAILAVGGSELQGIGGVLSGQTGTNSGAHGSVSVGGTKVKL